MVTRKTTATQSTAPDFAVLTDEGLKNLMSAVSKEQSRRDNEKANSAAAHKARWQADQEDKAKEVNTRLAEIKTELAKLEREVEILVNSVDADCVWVGFEYEFGVGNSTSYNNSDKQWSSSSY